MTSPRHDAPSPTVRIERWVQDLSWGWKLLIPVLIGQAVFVIPWVVSLPSWPAKDWEILTDAGARITNGINPYHVDGFERLRFSPLVAHFFAFITPLGMAGYTLLSFASLAIIRDWRLIALFLVALPFWIDIASGTTFLPVPVLAIAALRGSFAAKLGFVALAVLIPRPLMLPVLAWLLWHDRSLRLPALGIALALTAGAVATGWAGEWITDLIRAASSEDPRPVIQPAAYLGPFWVAMVAFGAWLAIKGHLGLASLAFAPYWSPSYFMLLLVELARPRAGDESRTQRKGRSEPS